MKLQDEMFSLIESWQESGLSKREFLSDKGVKASKFNYWLYKYRQGQSSPPSRVPPVDRASGDFKSFVLPDQDTCGKDQLVSMEITTPSGVRITIYR